MRIALVSDLTPVPLTAGPLVLYRHFRRMTTHEILVVSGAIPEADPAERNWEVKRLPRRLSTLRRRETWPLFIEWRTRQIVHESRALLDRFGPEVIVTVWMWEFLVAARQIAGRRRVPLVVICHDDIEVSLPGGPATRRWARRRLGEVYRSASARLCISEAMEQTFRERYGAEGAVLPPIGDAVQTEPTEQRSGGIRIGCGGNVGGGNLAPLLAIADALGAVGGVLYITGATGGRDRERLSTHAAVRDDGFLPTADEMRAHFRESVDAMVVVQSFEPEDRSTVSLNFPSKLVEACAIGLPLLVVAPAGSSSAEWVRKAPGSAVLVESVSPELLAQGLERMRNPATRRDLKDGLVRRGSVEFGPDAIHGRLEAALAAAVAG